MILELRFSTFFLIPFYYWIGQVLRRYLKPLKIYNKRDVSIQLEGVCMDSNFVYLHLFFFKPNCISWTGSWDYKCIESHPIRQPSALCRFTSGNMADIFLTGCKQLPSTLCVWAHVHHCRLRMVFSNLFGFFNNSHNFIHDDEQDNNFIHFNNEY